METIQHFVFFRLGMWLFENKRLILFQFPLSLERDKTLVTQSVYCICLASFGYIPTAMSMMVLNSVTVHWIYICKVEPEWMALKLPTDNLVLSHRPKKRIGSEAYWCGSLWKKMRHCKIGTRWLFCIIFPIAFNNNVYGREICMATNNTVSHQDTPTVKFINAFTL